MDVIATVEVPVAPEKLFGYISDLVNYESWLEIVHSVKLFDANSWTVELRARLGPFARSKRLRMVRTSCDEPNSVVFERVEKDERRHSSWVLSATVSKTTTGSSLETKLHYSGSLFTGGLLERALADQIKTGREKLIQQLSVN
jgi:carbon monoxide dehydrogenase subunit G